MMKVILLADVYKHGVAGEIVTVADGFARNYLFPRKLAVKATEGELRRASKLRENAKARRAAYENKLNELAREIDGVELVFGRRAAPTGKLFGSVTTQEIADALMAKTGVDINRRRISQQTLREIGLHDVLVRLGSEISPVLKVNILREEDYAEYLAAERAAANRPAEGQLVEEQPAEATPAENVAEMPTEVLPKAVVEEAMQRTASASESNDAPAE
jgi:large subunit ribosomal protein L9